MLSGGRNLQEIEIIILYVCSAKIALQARCLDWTNDLIITSDALYHWAKRALLADTSKCFKYIVKCPLGVSSGSVMSGTRRTDILSVKSRSPFTTISLEGPVHFLSTVLVDSILSPTPSALSRVSTAHRWSYTVLVTNLRLRVRVVLDHSPIHKWFCSVCGLWCLQ